MAAQHIKRWKGCCMMCAGWIRGQSKLMQHVADVRKLGGKKAVKHKQWKRPED